MYAWRYDPGQGKKKHAWAKDDAGFVSAGRGFIGKCPKSLTLEKAEQLLNEGFPVWEDDDFDVPSRIYNVYKGVVYEARQTEYGKSFHGFPWRGDMGIGRPILAKIWTKLEARVEDNQEHQEFKRWIKNYG